MATVEEWTSSTELEPAEKTSKYARLSESDMGLILRLKAADYEQKAIAQIIGCAQSTISDFLHRVQAPEQVVQKVLKAGELEAAAHWKLAAATAAMRGDHRPARELIEMANPGLRPQTGNSAGGVGVQVIIGQPGQPLALPDIVVSPARAQLQSETPLDCSGIEPGSHKADSVNQD